MRAAPLAALLACVVMAGCGGEGNTNPAPAPKNPGAAVSGSLQTFTYDDTIAPALFDPEIGINFALMVHGGQEFKWGPLVVAGDEIDTTVTVKDISERSGTGFYVFETVSVNQSGERVVRGTWTNIVRGV